MASPRVLLFGYNGACNTGAEALLLADIEDVRAVLGPDVPITVPSLNPANLRRYVRESPSLSIAPIPPIYFAALRRLVRSHDLVLLVEGSCYMDTWTSALLWAFLWATRCARAMGKPCLAYAVDAGELSPANQRRCRREASKTDLIVARSQAAAERLRAWGVTAPIEVTADNAFTFDTAGAANPGPPAWPEDGSGVAGIAAVDFHLWPVVMRPWGRKEDCYRWPYYFSRSQERRRATEALAADYALLADRIVTEHGKSVALIAMEALDSPLAREIHVRMRHPERARVFVAGDCDAGRMTALLRSLDVLVTSRYHASVLSLAAAVPQVAFGHDVRLESLYADLGIREQWFVPHDAKGRFDLLADQVRLLLADPGPVREVLARGHAEHLGRARRNRELLRAFVEAHGWETRA